MTDATTEFFEELDRRQTDPTLTGIEVTMRFDVTHDGDVRHWLVTIDDGEIGVTPGEGEADCTIGTDRRVLEAILEGRVNPMAALLRGQLDVAGDADLLVLIKRLFPMLPPAGQRQTVTSGGWRGP
jgi:putative sterol carrier protein